jgi:hypothetical protein
MYPMSKQENFRETTDMLPFYAYINQLFRRTLTPREWDGTKILTYNKNILAAAMAPNTNGFELSVFDFLGGDQGNLRKLSQELWLCSLHYAHD